MGKKLVWACFARLVLNSKFDLCHVQNLKFKDSIGMRTILIRL